MTTHQGATTATLRHQLAAAAFGRTASYDAAISAWFAETAGDPLPQALTVVGHRQLPLRYGENPHQQAALYRTGEARPGVVMAQQVQGKALSYNNIGDADAAFELAAEFTDPAIVIVKHANPCGVAIAEDLRTAYGRALACDPVSAFGGIVAANRPLDAATAAAITEIFCEVVIAPAADEAALRVLAGKQALRVLLTGDLPDPAASGMTVRSVAGGMLVQSRDSGQVARGDLRVVTQRAPEEQEWADLDFAFKVCKYVKSNAIVYAKEGATVGVGAGQMSRVDSARIAARKAAEIGATAGQGEARLAGSAAASDAFFPFADGLLALVEAGATAVIQPGGSIRDPEVIQAANDHNIAMVFAGMRHFRH